MIDFKLVTSLDKIFPDAEPSLYIEKGSMLKNERYNLQLCLYNSANDTEKEVKIKVTGDIAKYCNLRVVDYIPSVLADYGIKDDYYIFNDNSSRAYPDLLRPLEAGDVIVPCKKRLGIWCTIHCPSGLSSGLHKLVFTVTTTKCESISRVFEIKVIDANLPKSDLFYTNWMHYDSIANYYNVKPWSGRFYKLLGTFIDTAVLHGVNIMYTPVFTPPLDTKIGGERRDVQLVKVYEKEEDKYEFDLSELDKFITFCRERGVEYFEISHLATQWGAKACPKIMAYTKNGYKRIFGWDVEAKSDKYKKFLSCFLGVLDDYFTNKKMGDKVFFHISDEPNKSQFTEYKQIAGYIKSLIPKYKILDASSTESNEIVDIPVLSTTHIPENAKENVWAYYCCTSRDRYLSNRFFNMPSQRNRVLGFQLYEQECKGFLHWGFNFYNTIFSYHPINPYAVSDAGGAFPSGDSYVVYPGDKGALDSLRLEVFYDGLQDRMALKLLEKYIGRDAVRDMLHAEGIVGWSSYPRDAVWHIGFREKINGKISELVKG